MSEFDSPVPNSSAISDGGGSRGSLGPGKQTLVPPVSGGATPKTTTRELVVSVPSTTLHTGNPQGEILKKAATIAASWNLSVDNFGVGVEALVRTIDHAQLKAADPGIINKLWEQAKTLLEKGATFVSGTPFAATLGFVAIEKLLAYQEKLEEARSAADEKTFLARLHKQLNEVRQAGVEDGSNIDINGVVDSLEEQFLQLGREHPEDAWKEGDRVVFGAQHEFLKDLANRATQYRRCVPSVNAFETAFLTEWVNANHARRPRSALRSPFAESTYQDGYVEAKLVLDYSPLGHFFLHQPGAAKLHCPKAVSVAESLMLSMEPFSLDKLYANINFTITVTDDARRHLRTKDLFGEVKLDANHMIITPNTFRQWEWLMANTATTTSEILGRFTSLVGAS